MRYIKGELEKYQAESPDKVGKPQEPEMDNASAGRIDFIYNHSL